MDRGAYVIMELWRFIFHSNVYRALTEREKEHLVREWLFSKWWNSSECYKKRMQNRINYIVRRLRHV